MSRIPPLNKHNQNKSDKCDKNLEVGANRKIGQQSTVKTGWNFSTRVDPWFKTPLPPKVDNTTFGNGHIPNGHIPNGHIPNGHIPNGHIPVYGTTASNFRSGSSPGLPLQGHRSNNYMSSMPLKKNPNKTDLKPSIYPKTYAGINEKQKPSHVYGSSNIVGHRPLANGKPNQSGHCSHTGSSPPILPSIIQTPQNPQTKTKFTPPNTRLPQINASTPGVPISSLFGPQYLDNVKDRGREEEGIEDMSKRLIHDIEKANNLVDYIRSRYLDTDVFFTGTGYNDNPDYYNYEKYKNSLTRGNTTSENVLSSTHYLGGDIQSPGMKEKTGNIAPNLTGKINNGTLHVPGKVDHSNLASKNVSSKNDDGQNKVKFSLSRRPITHRDVSTYVDEDIIKSTYEHLQKEMETSYEPCNEEERIELYKLFHCDNITIKTLIEWSNLYHEKRRTRCGSIDLKRLHHLKEPLQELDNMVGLKKFKENIVEQILLCLQGLHRNKKDDSQEMYHTVIFGPPGVGKTQLAKILGHIYIAMGLMHKRSVDLTHFDIEDYFETAARSDLIGMYCGHTAVQTQKIIDRCRKGGKVLFIDETYSLGGERSDKDNFSKECIDTINKNLTEGAGEFICIIAGYPEDIKKCFFSHNKGLERRFNFRYTIDKYTPSEMKDIFVLKLEENGWSLATRDEVTPSFFSKNEEYFPHYGGDIVTLLQKCKISHAKRIFAHENELPRRLTAKDIENGFNLYKKERTEIEDKKRILNMMYM